jgi:hypothetical protein
MIPISSPRVQGQTRVWEDGSGRVDMCMWVGGHLTWVQLFPHEAAEFQAHITPKLIQNLDKPTPSESDKQVLIKILQAQLNPSPGVDPDTQAGLCQGSGPQATGQAGDMGGTELPLPRYNQICSLSQSFFVTGSNTGPGPIHGT